MENDYKIGDSVYLVSNFKIIKVFILEIVTKETLEGTGKQYNIRPYGVQKLIHMTPDRLYATLEDAKIYIQVELKKFTEAVQVHLEQISDDVFENAEVLLTKQEEPTE